MLGIKYWNHLNEFYYQIAEIGHKILKLKSKFKKINLDLRGDYDNDSKNEFFICCQEMIVSG